MLKNWNKRYADIAAKSRKSSQFGSFVILIFGLIEALSLIKAIYITENVSWEVVYYAATPILLIVLVFGLRFFLFFRFASSIIVRSFTWWSIVIVIGVCWVYVGPAHGAFYSLFHSFPLQVSGGLYVIIGTFRWLYFALASFRT
jgi:hypothetical protein